MTQTMIDHVALTVRDLRGMARFYETALGLSSHGGDGETCRLGAGDRVLLELRRDIAAPPRDPRQPGLFHTAFLLPGRADLGRWLRHAAQSGVRLTGASDHGVSEAVYLDDPEGNGIEIYRDRPQQDWSRQGDRIEMFTMRLDLDDLAAAASGDWQGAPQGATVGHVHLQVGDLDRADDFFRNDLGLARTFDAPGGAWYGWNGYHHHLAGNVWNSRGAGPRDPNMTGLAEVIVKHHPRAGSMTQDPWGTHFRFI
ncbi:VOC family protein [Paracoccus sp. R12_1]|uniref:VOC family protein n=1 Tax=unclassified Paracoccus (in: a-proteobacteria) TaxID=2688777 RepID=UPI001ADB1732|nr:MULTISPECIES: VOC family protein [unclassified Paracoccus (in: a-proteobacteria)]MBO9456342.1 VOC family protein [Paracoccus sp. R12_2]MBO9487551.1 VOC family protein [Paracoccus sp. R12_1]